MEFWKIRLLRSLPFSYLWILKRAIGSDARTILDLGCGEGYPLRYVLSDKDNPEITGVDIFPEALKNAEKSGIYNKLVKADISKLPRNILSKRFDLVFSSQVLEHLPRSKAIAALNTWESLAKKRIVVTTTNGFFPYNPFEGKKDKNPFQRHKSGWTATDFRKRRYKVYGQGSRLVYGPKGLIFRYRKFNPLLRILALIFAPLVYFRPSLGTYLICVKSK